MNRNGRFVLIEINARTIMVQEMITRSGLDVPLIAYHDAMGLPLPVPGPVVPVRWIHLGGDFRAFRQMRRAGSITPGTWLRIVVTCNVFGTQPFTIRLPSLSGYGRGSSDQVRLSD